MDDKGVIHLFGKSAHGAEWLQALQGGRKTAGVSVTNGALPLRRKSTDPRSQDALAHSSAAGSAAMMRRPRKLVRARQIDLPENSSARATERSGALSKLTYRFLSWCFPLREFNSPLQRLLYLSVEGPKSKSSKRLRVP